VLQLSAPPRILVLTEIIALARAYRGEPNPPLTTAMAHAMMARQDNGPYGLGGAVDGSGKDLVLLKRGQNVGYQGYMLIFPETGKGIVVLANSDNGVCALRTTRNSLMVLWSTAARRFVATSGNWATRGAMDEMA
jgi:hypothetical protein